MHGHDDGEMVQDASFWDNFYRSSDRIWSGEPNPQLVAEVTDVAPGLALDVGCGEGADALWLAAHGWSVLATDMSSVALARAAEHAIAADAAAAARIKWRQVDLLTDAPPPESFDLVSVHFLQLPPEPRARLFTSLAATVKGGGILLVVGHHPSDLHSAVHRPPFPEMFYSSEDVAELLDASWTVVVSEARPRPAAMPGGAETTIHDAVLLASRNR